MKVKKNLNAYNLVPQKKNLTDVEKPPPRLSRTGGWVGGSARKAGGHKDKFLLFLFLLGVAGGSNSER